MPGHRLNGISEFFWSKKTYDRVFKQQIADMQLEYIEAVGEDRKWKARWIVIRGVICFWGTAGFQLYDCSIGKMLRGLIRTQ